MERNYWNDGRVRAVDERWQGRVDESRMVSTFVLVDEFGDEEDVIVPVAFAVCSTCDGRGSHANPSIDCDGLTAKDFHDDPDFAEEYCSGRYDVACYECGGKRVVPVIDEERAGPELVARVREQQRADAEYAAERRAERALGY